MIAGELHGQILTNVRPFKRRMTWGVRIVVATLFVSFGLFAVSLVGLLGMVR